MARTRKRVREFVRFAPQLPRQKEVASLRLVRSRKKPSQNLNPENSLNETVLGTARHVQRVEHDGIEWPLLTTRKSGPLRAAVTHRLDLAGRRGDTEPPHSRARFDAQVASADVGYARRIRRERPQIKDFSWRDLA